jgi:GTP cyclohydrolase II
MTLALQSIVHRSGQSRLPTRHGLFSAYAYRIEDQLTEHMALSMGEILQGEAPLVRIHS